MRITYDPEADALQIELNPDTEVRDSVDIEEGVTADLDAAGHVIGIEILDAKERFGESVESITFERLVKAAGEQAAAR